MKYLDLYLIEKILDRSSINNFINTRWIISSFSRFFDSTIYLYNFLIKTLNVENCQINFLVTFVLLLIVEITLLSLNFIYDGVPMYRHFNLSEDQVISCDRKFKQNKLEILDDFISNHFKAIIKKVI